VESLEQRTVPDAVPLNNFEQYFLELTNRARQDPAGEAARLGIDLNEGLPAGTITTAVKQPLAPNAALLSAIRGHIQDMLTHQFFDHTGSDGSTPQQRITNAGYQFTDLNWGENIAWQGTTVTPDETALTLAAYQSLFIDKFSDVRGHRTTLLNGNLKEIGPGEATGMFMGFNAVLACQDFGTRAGNSFLTGVVYRDTVVQDNFYTPGEGIGQVTITAVSDQGVTTMEVTGSAGGYSLQLAPGTYTVTASGGTLQNPMTVRGIVIGTSNVKQDFIVPPAVPTLTVSTTTLNLGTTSVGTAGSPQTYTISGSTLAANVVLTAPGGVELSTDGTNYSNTLTLTPGNGTLATTTISARISAAAALGTISGKITDTSTGAPEQDVSVSGMVITQATQARTFQVVAPTNVVAGMPFDVTVTAVDAQGNTVLTYTGKIHFSTSDTGTGVMLPADYTFTAADNGVHTFNGVVLGTAGNTTLTVSDVNFSEFSIATANSAPSGITVGPDGNLWFTEYGGNKVAKITPAGAITEFAVNGNPFGITAGPDGNLWFTETSGNKIGRITPDGSTVKEFPIPTSTSYPFGITVGPDGNLWFTEYGGNKIGRITPDGSTVMEFPTPTNNSGPFGITVGPDGNLWFAEYDGNKIGRITPDGSTVMEFPIPTNNSFPQGITAGPDGFLWFTETSGNKIGEISPFGGTEFSVPTTASVPRGITGGPDGNLWFTEQDGNKIGQITPAGTILEFSIPTTNSGPSAITVGPDGNLWFTERTGNKVGRITSILGTATVQVTPGGGGAAARFPGADRFGGNPGGSDWSASATVPSATAKPLTASVDPESWPVRVQAVTATAHRAALSDPVGSDLADLLFSGPWLEGPEWHAGR
jgi:streptogramin lyase/uncharacterized protein YkwD